MGCDSHADAFVPAAPEHGPGGTANGASSTACHSRPVACRAVLDLRISDHVTPLVGVLAELLADVPPDPFRPEWVAVPSIGMRRWLVQRLSLSLGAAHGRSDGVSANIGFPFPAELRRSVLAADAALRGVEGDPWDVRRLPWVVLAVLDRPETAADPVLGPLTRRAEGLTSTGRAASLADLVDRYLLHRPGMVRRWISGDDVDAAGAPLADQHRWQPALVRAMRDVIGVPSPAECFDEVLHRLRCGELEVDLPDRIFMFGLSTLPPDTVLLLDALAEHRSVHGLLLAPSVVASTAVLTHVRSAAPARRSARTAGMPVLQRHGFDTGRPARHPLLRSWGEPSRETAALLGASHVAVGVVGAIGHQPRFGDEAPAVPEPATVLGRLQVGIRQDLAASSGSSPTIAVGDRSLQVHSCTGRTRQVEVLRDAILHLLDADDSLTEGDIAVLCPRMDDLAPVIQSVLGPSAEHHGGSPRSGHVGRPGDPTAVPPRLVAPVGRSADPRSSSADGAGRTPALRYRITDRDDRAEVPLFAALGALLDLLPGRFAASEVADLLGLPPVRERFGLSVEDLGRLDEWIEQANVRWGLDGPHRSGWGLPETFASNTWAGGLDRLLVSTTMRPDGATLAVGGVAPLQVADGAAVAAARVADAVRTLGVLRERTQDRRTLADWCDLLAGAVAQLCSLPSSEAWQVRRLDRLFAELVDESSTGVEDASTSPVLLTLADVRRVLAERLVGDSARAAFGTGAITFCSLSPLRSVPHRVVCILGLDQDAMPRGRPSGDDLLAAAPALGDRDRRSESRHLLLEAVLSAQQALVITCGGTDVRTNAPIPPAVVLDELWDCLSVTYDLSPEQVRERLLVEHPRQAFDVRNFRAGAVDVEQPVPWSFDPASLAGACSQAEQRRDPELTVLVPAPLAATDTGEELRLDDLSDFLRRPVPSFLTRTLQLRLPDQDDVVSDELPVQLAPLEGWRIGAALMDAHQAGLDHAAVAAQLRAAGSLPPGSLGDDVLIAADEEVTGFVEVAAELGVGLAADDDEPVRVLLGDRTLVGTVPVHRSERSAPGPLLVRFSRPKPHHVLLLGVRLLTLTAADPERDWRAVSIHRGAKKGQPPVVHDLTVAGEDADDRRDLALASLDRVVELWDLGRRIPLPLFDGTSYELAVRGWELAARRWDPERYPESTDPAVRMAFGVRSVDELRSLRVEGSDPREWAHRLWDPFREALVEAGTSW